MARIFKGMFQAEIEDQLTKISQGLITSTNSVNSFICKRTNNEWIVEFVYKTVGGFTLKVKHTQEQRTFKTLDAVASWMKKMGIKEFNVILK